MEKRCIKCEEIKTLDKFPINHYTLKNGTKTKYYRNTCSKCRSIYRQELLTPDYIKIAGRKKVTKKFGITVEDFHRMKQEQNNLCYICKNPNNGRGELHIDHDHETGLIRKLLCHSCNTVLGHAKDSIDVLNKLIEYLKEHEK